MSLPDLIANQSIKILNRDGYVDGYLCMWGSHVPHMFTLETQKHLHDMLFGYPEKAGWFMYLDERHVLEFT
jgi:hypothetical protein